MVLIAGAALTTAAGAATVSFSSDGRFTGVAGCDAGFLGLGGCAVTAGGNVLDMSGSNNSTLIATDSGPVTFTGDADDVTIGQITWVNNASGSLFYPTDPNFTVSYVLTLTFAQPSADIAGQAFALNIRQPSNPSGDRVSGFLLTGLAGSFHLAGLTVSDLRFSESGSGSFEDGVWRNPEGGLSRLRLTADFTVVPEPASLALLGAGMLGLVAVRRRRQREVG